MIVEKLDVARRKAHLEGEFLGQRHQQIDRLPLRGRQLRHARHELRRLDVGQRIMAGEAAVALAKDRQRIGERLAARLLAEPAAPDVAV
jgi:hypothetical protein